MNADLKQIIRIQSIDLSVQELRAKVEGFPATSRKLDEKLSSATTALDSVREKIKTNQATRKKLEAETGSHEAKISKYREQMLSVKTNEEYKALQKEIEHAGLAIRKIEDDILALMMEAESLQQELKQAEAQLKNDQQAVNVDRKALEEENRKDQAALDAYLEERKQVEAGISDDALMTRYERVRKARGGVAVAAARNYICEMCKVRIRPQVFQEIRKNDRIIPCDACQRFLYDPENMDHPFEVA
ncbi:MAG TPA: C4-type zinc ribbon domain-containing protein [Terriglobia bacterium]|nr:C4-type zinc ribbon domain-containing protein [Terriglobia bacterium]